MKEYDYRARELSPEARAQVNALSEQLRSEALALVRKSSTYLVLTATVHPGPTEDDLLLHTEHIVAVDCDSGSSVVAFYLDAARVIVDELAQVLQVDQSEACAYLIGELFSTIVLQDPPDDDAS